MKNNTEKSEKSVFIRDKIMMMPFVCGKEYYFGKKFENALLYFVTFLMVLFWYEDIIPTNILPFNRQSYLWDELILRQKSEKNLSKNLSKRVSKIFHVKISVKNSV